MDELVERADAIARDVLRPRAEREDREAAWPEAGMRALAEAGLTGLNAPVEVGGHGLGLESLVRVARSLAREHPSASICYGMHCVGTAVVAAKATPDQTERFLRPIAEGEHITTLALSEPGTGSAFYIPETRVVAEDDDYVVNGTKSFVTNGGRADSYVVSVAAEEPGAGEGVFSAVLVEAGTPGVRWGDPWRGFGMRANSSRTVRLDDVRVSRRNLLGEEGDELWYVFDVVLPYFLTAMAGTYLGIAEGAVALATEHLGSRRHSHTGELLSAHPTLSGDLGAMWIDLESTRSLVLSAARRADAGAADALRGVLASKAAASEAAVDLTDRAMTLMGGRGYGEGGRLGRLLRDARASHVMAPTTHQLRIWLGRALTGIPLLQ